MARSRIPFIFCLLFSVLVVTPSSWGGDTPAVSFPESDPVPPDQLMASISQGWPSSYQGLEGHLDSAKSYLVILSRTPKAHMDLRSPENLRRSFLATSMNDADDIGHNAFGWSCPRSNEKWKKGFTSQTGELKGQTEIMLKSGWGLSSLFAIFTDGKLRTPQENEMRTIRPNLDSSKFKLFTLIVEVSDQDCDQVVHFMEEYTSVSPVTHRYAAQNFGLVVNPLKLQGGGCGSTAVVALDQGHFFGELGGDFMRKMSFNKKVLGQRISDVTPDAWPRVFYGTTVDHPVALQQLLEMNWNGDGHDNSTNLKVIDPEMMFLFYRTIYAQELDREEQKGSIHFWTKANLLGFVTRSMRERNLGIEEVSASGGESASQFEIDGDYDQKASDVVKDAKAWFEQKITEGYSVERPRWGSQAALIFQKK